MPVQTYFKISWWFLFQQQLSTILCRLGRLINFQNELETLSKMVMHIVLEWSHDFYECYTNFLVHTFFCPFCMSFIFYYSLTKQIFFTFGWEFSISFTLFIVIFVSYTNLLNSYMSVTWVAYHHKPICFVIANHLWKGMSFERFPSSCCHYMFFFCAFTFISTMAINISCSQ